MVYKWRTRYHKTKPEVAGEELQRIKNKRGLTAKAVVDESRDEDAPLHKEFTWDDAVAAEKFREEEARSIISDLIIELDGFEGGATTRGFVKLERSHKAGVYEDVREVLMDSDKTNALLEIAKAELQSFRQKYATLKELAGVMKAIDEL